MKMNSKNLTRAAFVAAVYVVLTYIATLLGLSNGAVQIRFSEALCVLPIFNAYSVPGLFVGCIISNILAGANIFDIVFGSLATLLGAYFTRKFRRNTFLAILSPIFFNTLIIPFVLTYAYKVKDAMWFLFLSVGAGEVISVGILGYILYRTIKKSVLRSNIGQDDKEVM